MILPAINISFTQNYFTFLARVLICLFIIFNSSESFCQNSSDSTVSEKKVKITAYPAIGYAPETSLTLGAVGFLVIQSDNSEENEFHRPSSVSPYFLYTLQNQFLSAVKFEFYPGSNFNINSTIRFFNYPDYYFGIGNETSGEREQYTDKFFKWDGDFLYTSNQRVFLGISYQYLNTNISDIVENGVLENENVNGIEGGQIIGIGPIFKLDTRNDIFYPDKGVYLEIKTLFNPDAIGNDYAFNNIKIDFRNFRTVFSDKNILGIQFYYNHTNGKSVPFYMLPQLGGDSRLRGINHENRYRDNHAYFLQLEGRRHLFWRLGGVIFAGIGDVTSNLQSISFSTMKYVIGLGGRFKPFKTEKLNIRLDIGKGPKDQYGIYIAVREAF